MPAIFLSEIFLSSSPQSEIQLPTIGAEQCMQ